MPDFITAHNKTATDEKAPTQTSAGANEAVPLRLLDLLKPQRWSWRLAMLLGFITLVATVLLLAYSGWFISAAAVAGIAAIQAGTFNYMRPGAMIRLLAISRTAGRYAEKLQSHYAVLQLLKTLRLNSFAALCRKPNQQLNYLTDPNHADQLQRLIADIDLLDQFPLKVWLPWLWAGATALCYLVAAGYLLPQGLPGFTLILLLLLFQPLWLHLYGKNMCHRLNVQAGTRRQQLLHQLQLLTTTLMLGHWSEKAKMLADTDHKLNLLQRALQRSVVLQQGIQQLLLLSGFLCLLWAQSQQQQLAPALVVALALGWLGLSEIFTPLAQFHLALGYSLTAQKRYNELLSAPSAEPVPPATSQTKPTNVSAGEVTIELHQLQIGFISALPQLPPLTASFKAGDVVLLHGPSGCGKSCLLQTLAGDLTILGGELLWQKQPLHQLHSHQKYQQIGYGAQRPHIFNLTVAANLRLACPTASDDELLTVLHLVELRAWLDKQPEGLATVLGQYGCGLSGGESRRFALARLLLQKPGLLLLDEPFAGLEQELASRLLQRLAEFQQQGILIIASHQQLQHPAFNRHWQLAPLLQ